MVALDLNVIYIYCVSWLELVFLQSEIRERRGWGKVLATKNRKCDMNLDQTLDPKTFVNATFLGPKSANAKEIT